jgi:hypothetical protein
MSTFKIEGKKMLDGIFPERKWEELKSEIYDEVFQKLSEIEQLSSEVVAYMKEKSVRIGFHKQYKSGGGWTFLRNITLSPGDDPLNPYVLSLIIHETFHLKQTIWTRLSMQGELRAWQYQMRTYPHISRNKGAEIGSSGEAYGESRVTKEHWDELSSLSPDSREDLEKAQEIMTKISPGYRSGCLPLYPMGKEFKYFWGRNEYVAAFGVIWKLITCR